ncbi:MAG: porin [Phycisphaerales bacterium JB043]
MSRTFSLSLLAGAAISVSGTAAIADTNTNSDEVRALVSEMLNDAQTRSSLLQGGGSAGHDGHFFMASADGNFRLNVSGQVQFRWVLNTGDEAANASYGAVAGSGGNDDFQHGFENRRTKLVFSGDAFGDWFYKIQGAFSSSGGGFGLQDAYVGTTLEDGAKLVFGQFKVPLHREELVSSKHQQAVDRSLTNEYFNAGRTQGIAYKGESGDNFRYAIALTDGAGQANTFFGDVQDAASPVADSDIAITARGEILLEGSWDVFKDMTSAPGQEQAMMLGFAAHYQQGAEEPGAGNFDDADLTAYTVDFSMEGDGWNAFAAFSAQNVDPQTVGASDSDDFGFVVQGGYYFNDDTEGFLRYDMLAVDDNRFGAGGNDEISTITFGVNHYLHGHAAKLTVDANFALDEAVTTAGAGLGTNVMFTNPGIGYLGDDDSDEFYIRAQLQLLF